MKDKRLRTKLFQVWLQQQEYDFIAGYAEKNMITASELIRGWIKEIMKIEGHDIIEPRNPELYKRR